MTHRRIVVVSPHLDDAVLSLGATIAAAASAGADVCVLTVFAGELDDEAPASEWDARAGFRSAGEAARARRDEDVAACGLLGARTAWLEDARASAPAELGRRLHAELRDADLVLIPGFPCAHADHALVTRCVLAEGVPGELAFYVEQPYAMWRLVGHEQPRRLRVARLAGLAARARSVRAQQEPVVPGALQGLTTAAPRWSPMRVSTADRRLKHEASRHYRSQFRVFGRAMLPGIACYEWSYGGEGVGTLVPGSATSSERAGKGDFSSVSQMPMKA